MLLPLRYFFLFTPSFTFFSCSLLRPSQGHSSRGGWSSSILVLFAVHRDPLPGKLYSFSFFFFFRGQQKGIQVIINIQNKNINNASFIISYFITGFASFSYIFSWHSLHVVVIKWLTCNTRLAVRRTRGGVVKYECNTQDFRHLANESTLDCHEEGFLSKPEQTQRNTQKKQARNKAGKILNTRYMTRSFCIF